MINRRSKYIIISYTIPTIITLFYILVYPILTLMAFASLFVGWDYEVINLGKEKFSKNEVLHIQEELLKQGAVIDTAKFCPLYISIENNNFINASYSYKDLSIQFSINWNPKNGRNYIMLYKIWDNTTNSELCSWLNSDFNSPDFPLVSPFKFYKLETKLYEDVIRPIDSSLGITNIEEFEDEWNSEKIIGFIVYSYWIYFIVYNPALISIFLFCLFYRKYYAVNLYRVYKNSGISNFFRFMRKRGALISIFPKIIFYNFRIVKYSESKTRIDFWLEERMNLRTKNTGIDFIGFSADYIIQGASFRNKEVFFHVLRREYLNTKTGELFTMIYQPSKEDINDAPNLVSILTYNNSQPPVPS